MSASRLGRLRAVAPRFVAALVACVAIVVAGIATRDLVAEEAAQAAPFVAQATHDLEAADHAAANLALERARWLAPRSPALRATIAVAGIVDAEPAPMRAVRWVTSREWAALATGAGWIAGAGLALFFVKRQKLVARAAIVSAGVCALAVGAAAASSLSSPGIVTAAEARVLVAPYAAADAEATLPAGAMVVAGARYRDYVHVELPDGVAGWTQATSVAPIAAAAE